MFNCIIFSKDRACQLELLLRSIKIFFGNWQEFKFSILYTYSDHFYLEGYQKLKSLHPEFDYIDENSASTSFKEKVLSLIQDVNPYTIFFVDDLVFRQFFSISDNTFKVFIQNESILCLSLRLCPRINFCYSQNKPSPPPQLDKSLIWNWCGAVSETDWSYPMSLDGHIFRTHQIKPLVELIEFYNPNSFESLLSQYPIELPQMICYPDSRIVNIPANRVQDTYKNRHGNLISVKELNSKFLKDELLSLKQALELENTSVHEEIPLFFQKVLEHTTFTKIYIYLCCHNQGLALPVTVERLLMQSVQNLEIIIIDEESTDGTKDIAKQIIAAYPTHQIRFEQAGEKKSLQKNMHVKALYITPDYPISQTFLINYLDTLKLIGEKDIEAACLSLFQSWQRSQFELDRVQFCHQRTIDKIASMEKELLETQVHLREIEEFFSQFN